MIRIDRRGIGRRLRKMKKEMDRGKGQKTFIHVEVRD